MICPNCAEEVPGGAQFCPYCGTKFLAEPTETLAGDASYLPPEEPSVQNAFYPPPVVPTVGNTSYPSPETSWKKKNKEERNKLPIIVIAFSSLVIIISLFLILRSGILKVGFGNSGSGNEETSPAAVTPNAAAQAAENIEDTAQATPTEEPVPTDTPTPIPTATPIPTVTPEPTATPVPTATLVPEVVIPEVITIYDGIQATAADFLFPESSSEYLTTARMNQVMESSDSNRMHYLSQLAINELLARYGYTFTSSSQTAQDARDQFENKDWYQSVRRVCPSNQWDVLRANYFNSYERANFDALNQWQKDHGVYY